MSSPLTAEVLNPRPLLRTSSHNYWYEEMLRTNRDFARSWRVDTHTVRNLLNDEALIAIDPRLVKPSVKKKGQIVARCSDPDQADRTWKLIKEKYKTTRNAPFSDLVGGPRVFPGSRFNRQADISASWVHGFRTILEGKSVGGVLLTCHMPCLGAFHEGVAIKYLFWELKQAKRAMLGLLEQYPDSKIDGLDPKTIDLAVQVDFCDTRETGLYLVNEPIMKHMLDRDIHDGLLPIS